MQKYFLNSLSFLLSFLFFNTIIYADNNNLVKLEATYDSLNSAGKLNKIVSNLSSKLTNRIEFNNNDKIAIASFVSLNNFNKTDNIGNIISENLIYELQSKGFNVVDFKTMNNIKIKKNGDFVFSRDIKDLRTKYSVKYILSGTSTAFKTGLSINARIIAIKDHSVIATGQIWIPNDIIQDLSNINNINENIELTMK